MPNQTKIKLNSVDITIDHKENTVRLFDWSAMEQVMFYASDWREIKSAIDSQLGGESNHKQKQQTSTHSPVTDWFQSAKSVKSLLQLMKKMMRDLFVEAAGCQKQKMVIQLRRCMLAI